MGILLVVALILAWPTFGLSLVVWLVVMIMRSKAHVNRIVERENRMVFIEPLFGERFADFVRALDIPLYPGGELTEQDAHQCGRHIMHYIAHNPSESALFMRGLEFWKTKGSNQPADPVTAANDERTLDHKGEIHLVSYRAIEAVVTNNRGLRCFSSVDVGTVVVLRARLEIEMLDILKKATA